MIKTCERHYKIQDILHVKFHNDLYHILQSYFNGPLTRVTRFPEGLCKAIFFFIKATRSNDANVSSRLQRLS